MGTLQVDEPAAVEQSEPLLIAKFRPGWGKSAEPFPELMMNVAMARKAASSSGRSRRSMAVTPQLLPAALRKSVLRRARCGNSCLREKS
jgi:hypothetical protein